MFELNWFLSKEKKVRNFVEWENIYLENQKNFEYVEIRKKVNKKNNMIRTAEDSKIKNSKNNF
jgi:hypothetical protein